MTRALELAARGLYTTTPNPRVGCVIVRDGRIIGEGWHRRTGEAHAEVLALASLSGLARGATAYVTLEPCSHHGSTPPCTDALIEAGIARVVTAMEDPNPRVNGRGLARLRAAGIDVRCGLLEREARELNLGFVSRMTRGVPWVRLKIAASLDGRTALPDGRSQWITGPAARRDGHAWRARACAVLTGIGTVRSDDPRLNVREVETSRQPLKVVIDSRLELEPSARLLDANPTLVFAAVEHPQRMQALRDHGCEVVMAPGPGGKVDLPEVFRELARRHLNEIHVEAGFKLNGSLLRAGCVDELLLYQAPMLLGEATGMFNLPAPPELSQARSLEIVDLERVGEDVRLRARFKPGFDSGGAGRARAGAGEAFASGAAFTRDASRPDSRE